jgi:DNA-binding IclR family transcriptional regulator
LGQQELMIYRWLKDHSDKANPKSPATIAEMVGLPANQVRTLLARMFEKNVVEREASGFHVRVAPVAPVAPVSSVAPVASAATNVAQMLRLDSALESDKTDAQQAQHAETISRAQHGNGAWSHVPETQRTFLRLYMRSNKDSDQDRARMLCEQHGLDFDLLRKEISQ